MGGGYRDILGQPGAPEEFGCTYDSNGVRNGKVLRRALGSNVSGTIKFGVMA